MRTPLHPAREDLSLANILYALGDPVRLRIVGQLATAQQGVSCQHIVLGEGLPKSTQSHHFRVLREAGLIRMEPQGRRMLVSLRHEDVEARFPGLLDPILHLCRGERGSHAIA
ncbi:MAG TPA: metalloregulator ArsR/SmtB family transcription factor [Ktedonobacterales bacterium]